jgi:hypothetical protein
MGVCPSCPCSEPPLNDDSNRYNSITKSYSAESKFCSSSNSKTSLKQYPLAINFRNQAFVYWLSKFKMEHKSHHHKESSLSQFIASGQRMFFTPNHIDELITPSKRPWVRKNRHNHLLINVKLNSRNFFYPKPFILLSKANILPPLQRNILWICINSYTIMLCITTTVVPIISRANIHSISAKIMPHHLPWFVDRKKFDWRMNFR